MNTEINDKLDALISLAAKECGNDYVEMFNNLDTSNVKLDKSFHAKKRAIINKHKYESTVIGIKKFFVRIAVALLVTMSLGFLTIMAIPTLREAVFEAVIEWHENYIAVRYEQSEDGEKASGTVDESTTQNSEEDLNISGFALAAPTSIEVLRKPTYVPEGAVEDVKIQNKVMVYIDYYFNNELLYTYSQMLIKDRDKYIDNNTTIIDIVDINGQTGTIVKYTNKLGIAVIWCDDQYVYYLYTQNMNLDELIPICRSVE